MFMLKRVFLLGMLFILTACAKTEVSVLDGVDIEHENVHVIFVNDEFDDPLGVGDYLVKAFQKYGVYADKQESLDDIEQQGFGSDITWNANKDASKEKRIYLARYRYSYYWDNGDHIKILSIRIVDIKTEKTIATSNTQSSGSGVEGPVEQTAEDILTKLGFIAPKE